MKKGLSNLLKSLTIAGITTLISYGILYIFKISHICSRAAIDNTYTTYCLLVTEIGTILVWTIFISAFISSIIVLSLRKKEN